MYTTAGTTSSGFRRSTSSRAWAGEAAGCVDFASHYRFLARGETVVTQSRLRFLGQAELAAALQRAGLRATAWYGDWDRAPYRPDSPEIIVAAAPA